MSLVNEYFSDTNTFAVFSQLAKLLTAEDIIVRWNVRGMSSPAAMNMAGRILDVAPIKSGNENQIPGLIFHEVGHFLFSDNLSKKLEGHDVVVIDKQKFQQFRAAIKSHQLWNIIEDGYIERCVTAKWPGALKHLAVVHQHQKKQYGASGNFVIDVINTLHMNVMGMKWGERYKYDTRCSPKLMSLLEKARTFTGTTLARAELSSLIFDEIRASAAAAADKNESIAVPKAVIEPPVPNNPSKRDVSSLIHQQHVSNSAVLKDSSVPKSADTAEDFPDAGEQVPHHNNISDLPSSIKHEEKKKTDTSTSSNPALPKTEEEKKPKNKPAPIEQEEDTSPLMDEKEELDLVEFISDRASEILGSNIYYMQTIVDSSDSGEDRYIPSISEILLTSKIDDLIKPEVKKLLVGKSFNHFANEQLNQQYRVNSRDTKRLFSLYHQKMQQAKAIAQSMFQQFNAKANAMNIANLTRKTSGSLDPVRASLFMIYDDVFKKKQIAPNQINHGYVIMIDWSASIKGSAMEVFHRLAELTHFAKLAQVQLEVWLYTTDDSMISEKALLANSDKIRKNTLLTGSKFVNVLSTREHGQEDINYRLFTLYSCALAQKGHYKMVHNALSRINSELGFSMYFVPALTMAGTNIYESLVFAIGRTKNLTTSRKGIILITDGNDAGSFSIVMNTERDKKELSKEAHSTSMFYDDSHRGVSPLISKVMMGSIDLLAFSKTSKNQELPEINKYHSKHLFKNIRTTASFFAAEDARKNGISVSGITWGAAKSKELLTITRGNVVRINVPQHADSSKNISAYTPVNNMFISNITEALLSNIRK